MDDYRNSLARGITQKLNKEITLKIIHCAEELGNQWVVYTEIEAFLQKNKILDAQEKKDWLFGKANALYHLGNLKEAMQVIDEILLIQPRSDLELWLGSLISWELSEYEKATSWATEAITINPIAKNYTCRGTFYKKLGRFNEAEADFNSAVVLDNYELVERGWFFVEKKEYERGLADFLKMLELDPKNENAKRGQVVVYHKLGLNEQSMNILDSIIEQSAYHTSWDIYQKGLLHLTDGNLQFAKKQFEEVRRYDEYLSYYALGLYYLHVGNFNESIKYFSLPEGGSLDCILGKSWCYYLMVIQNKCSPRRDTSNAIENCLLDLAQVVSCAPPARTLNHLEEANLLISLFKKELMDEEISQPRLSSCSLTFYSTPTLAQILSLTNLVV